MFPRIQNETLNKECIRVRIRGALLAKKGAPKLNFHREGGQLPPSAPICPLKSPLFLSLTPVRSSDEQTRCYYMIGDRQTSKLDS